MELIQVLDLTDKDIKTEVVTIFQIFKKFTRDMHLKERPKFNFFRWK